MNIKKLLSIIGMLGGAGLMTAPVVMGQEIYSTKMSTKKIAGQNFVMKKYQVKAAKDTHLYEDTNTDSNKLYDLNEGTEFEILGYSSEYAVVDYNGGEAFVPLADIDLSGTGIKVDVKSTDGKKKKTPVFSDQTVTSFKELNIDLGKIDLSDESLYDGGTLKTYKDAAIAYGRAVKSNGENQESLKAEFENAKDGLLLKNGKKAIEKKAEEKSSKKTSSSASSSKETKHSSTPPSSSQSAPSTSSATPSASSSDKFQFPSVPQGLTIKDGKTLAAVAIEATAKMSLEGKDSPNQTIGKGVANIPEGANLQVTAISTDGVAEVSYEGQTVYVLTSGLS
jgi:hypothetical protein